MNRTQIVYLIALYVLVIGFGLYLNTASGDEGIQYIDHPRPLETALSCREYLSTCEKSCANRGGLFRFLCVGMNFNPDLDRYRCQCGDQAFEARAPKAEPKIVTEREK